MKLEVERAFALPYPGTQEEAVAFLADPERSLARVPFIRNLRRDGDLVRAELKVDVPLIGEYLMPFESRLEPRPAGADLAPRPLSGRAWAEVSGEGRAEPAEGGARIEYRLRVAVHLELPQEKWGGRAFAKMAERTAERTLERVTEEFPEGVRAAMPQP